MTSPRRLAAVCAVAAVTAVAASAWAVEAERGPAWRSLTSQQQQALAPLQRDWAGLDPIRKQKWLDVAGRFPALAVEDRQRLQQRMAEWARLTPAQRTDARLQYQELRQLPAEERRARWEAYQALSEDQRQQLAQKARPPAKPAGEGALAKARQRDDANAAKRNMVVPTSVPPSRAVSPSVVQAKPGATTTTMSTRVAPPAHNQAGLPKIAATPGYVDPATLLPRRGPQGAAVRAAATDTDEQP